MRRFVTVMRKRRCLIVRSPRLTIRTLFKKHTTTTTSNNNTHKSCNNKNHTTTSTTTTLTATTTTTTTRTAPTTTTTTTSKTAIFSHVFRIYSKATIQQKQRMLSAQVRSNASLDSEPLAVLREAWPKQPVKGLTLVVLWSAHEDEAKIL